MAALVFTNALSLEADLVLSWPVVTGLAAWLIGIIALVQKRRWGWYLTTLSAVALAVVPWITTGLLFHRDVRPFLKPTAGLYLQK